MVLQTTPQFFLRKVERVSDWRARPDWSPRGGVPSVALKDLHDRDSSPSLYAVATARSVDDAVAFVACQGDSPKDLGCIVIPGERMGDCDLSPAKTPGSGSDFEQESHWELRLINGDDVACIARLMHDVARAGEDARDAGPGMAEFSKRQLITAVISLIDRGIISESRLNRSWKRAVDEARGGGSG